MSFKALQLELLVLVMIIVLCTGCDQHNDDDDDDQQDGETFVILGVEGEYGDIGVSFYLDLAPDETRELSVSYYGGTAEEYTPATTTGQLKGLHSGPHVVFWNSWEDQAGLRGKYALRLETDAGERATLELSIDNAAAGQTGFFEFDYGDSGLGQNEYAAGDAAIAALSSDPYVDYVATFRDGIYEVYAPRGSVKFTRTPTYLGYEYEIIEQDGLDPFANQDMAGLSTLELELAAGGNPLGTAYPELGYAVGDPRLSFVEPENHVYPNAYERLAALFDHSDSPDLIYARLPYAHGAGGEHGSMDATQSRSSVIFHGAGFKAGVALPQAARTVDIAPTVAEALGMDYTFGIDERGIWSHHVYLKWQDGRVLDEVLSGEQAERALVIVFDGLVQTELLSHVYGPAEILPNFRRIADEGSVLLYGLATNYRSVTYPSHNTIGSGSYSGHHGLIDNTYYLRATDEVAAPIDKLINIEQYFDPLNRVETLYEAVHRSFGDWSEDEPEGAFTAAMFEPCTRGADFADTEFRDETGKLWDIPPMPPGTPDPSADSMSVMFEQLGCNISLAQFWQLYGGDESLPVPKLMIWNCPATDGGGHHYGPHGDGQREFVMTHADALLGVVLQRLELSGLLEETALIVTSDHGMELGDSGRSGDPRDSLDAAGVQYQAGIDGLVYLRCLGLEYTEPDRSKAGEISVTVRVFDDDDPFRVIPDAQVTLINGDGSIASGATDQKGLVTFNFTLRGEQVAFRAEHPSYNQTEEIFDLSK